MGERHHDREGVAELVEMIAHGDHVLLARQSSEVAMQHQQQWPTAMIAEAPRAAVVVDEGEVGEQLPFIDDGKRAHARPRIVASVPRSHGVRASIVVTISSIGGQACSLNVSRTDSSTPFAPSTRSRRALLRGALCR